VLNDDDMSVGISRGNVEAKKGEEEGRRRRIK
jgi:hypothetical protein